MDAAFPRRLRLTRAADYREVFTESRRLTSPALVLLYRRNGLNYSRLGLAISKKHVKRAVRRNRVKRQVREYFRLHRQETPGLDIVVLSRRALEHADREQVVRQLGRLWGKLQSDCAA